MKPRLEKLLNTPSALESKRVLVLPTDAKARNEYPMFDGLFGYFLLAIWGVNYGVVALLGVIVGLYIQNRYHPGVWSPMWLWLLPMPLLSFVLARHAKALFLAMDHYFDPHRKG